MTEYLLKFQGYSPNFTIWDAYSDPINPRLRRENSRTVSWSFLLFALSFSTSRAKFSLDSLEQRGEGKFSVDTIAFIYLHMLSKYFLFKANRISVKKSMKVLFDSPPMHFITCIKTCSPCWFTKGTRFSTSLETVIS